MNLSINYIENTEKKPLIRHHRHEKYNIFSVSLFIQFPQSPFRLNIKYFFIIIFFSFSCLVIKISLFSDKFMLIIFNSIYCVRKQFNSILSNLSIITPSHSTFSFNRNKIYNFFPSFLCFRFDWHNSINFHPLSLNDVSCDYYLAVGVCLNEFSAYWKIVMIKI